MAYKRIKDESGLIGKWILKSSIKPYYFHVFLWDNQNSFDRNTMDNIPNRSSGCVNLSSYIIYPERKIKPKLGEIHFIKDKWNMEIVAHELQHALIHRIRALEAPAFSEIIDQCGSSEEDICYEFGEWVNKVYSLLWEFNPGSVWTKTGETQALL